MKLSKTIAKLIVLAVPLIAGQLIIQGQGLFITSLTSKLGTQVIAGYALGYSNWILMSSFYLYFMTALGVIIARNAAQNDPDTTAKVVAQGYIVGLAFAVLLTIALFKMESILLFFNERGEIHHPAAIST